MRNRFPIAVCCAGVLMWLAGCSVNVPVMDNRETLEMSQARLERVQSEQQVLDTALDLPEAIARALLYNLDYRAAFMSETMAREDLARSHYAMWPQLAASAGYTSRNKYALSVSEDPNTGLQTLRASTSSDRTTRTAQLQMTWNALDFGVGYLRAKQKGNALLVAEEQRRKAFQAIVQNVTLSWWRAAAAQEMAPRVALVRDRIESALERSRRMEQLRLQSQFSVLDYQRDLLISLKRLTSLEEELLNAQTELAELVAVSSPGALPLEMPEALNEPDWLPALSLEQMRRVALANRPELRELNYRQRMASLEGKAAIAQLLPSLNLSAGPRYDSNSFLVHNRWQESGVQFSFNLLSLAALPATRRYGKAMEEAESLRADAMTVAVLSQLDVALQAIETDRKDWCVSRELNRVAEERERQQSARSQSAAGDELTWIRTELEAVLAGLESAFTYAELQASHALLLGSMGVDPYPADLEQSGVVEVAEQLRSYFANQLKQRLAEEAELLSDESDSVPVEPVEPALKPFEALCTL